MNRLPRVKFILKSVVGTIFAAILVGLGAFPIWITSCGKVPDIEVVESPDHKHIARSDLRYAAAMASNSLYVTLQKEGRWSLLSIKKTVLICREVYAVQLEWESPKKLRVISDCDPRGILKRVDKVHDVEIEHVLEKYLRERLRRVPGSRNDTGRERQGK